MEGGVTLFKDVSYTQVSKLVVRIFIFRYGKISKGVFESTIWGYFLPLHAKYHAHEKIENYHFHSSMKTRQPVALARG